MLYIVRCANATNTGLPKSFF